MILEQHLELKGKHSYLSPSKISWLNYDDDKLILNFTNSMATEIGSILHAYAADRIKFKKKMNRHEKSDVILELLRNGIPNHMIDIDQYYESLVSYVNDAIGFDLQPEVLLYYSDYCFGTTDAIRFDEKRKTLRIHDYKSGTTKVKMEQLQIYAALFCLQHLKKYNLTINDISVELRIYQGDGIKTMSTEDPEQDLRMIIFDIMNAIIHKSLVLDDFVGAKRR